MGTSTSLSSGRRLGKEPWIIAAKEALIAGGIEAVKIDHLASALNAQRGSFYHHFKNHQSLLEALLQHWIDSNSAIYSEASALPDSDAKAKLGYISTMWLEESGFNPHYDSAMRDWGRTDPAIADAVREVDQQRIAILQGFFEQLGYGKDDALGRARVAYFHQVGYIALGLNESPEQRRQLAPRYLAVLLGNEGKK